MEAVIENYPELKILGEASILIDFKPEITEESLNKVLFWKSFLEEKYLKEEVEIINTYSSLLILYHKGIEDAYSEVSFLKSLFQEVKFTKRNRTKTFYLPVCYDREFCPDLSVLSDSLFISEEEIIRRHTNPLYTVYFLGFLPGFLYLGGLDEKLYFPRRDTPRLEVQKGAVGIGGKQTGIYPRRSPGGWQIIGNSPVQLFDPRQNPPCEISAGDKLKFYSISKEEHRQISEDVKKGFTVIKSEK